MIIAQDLVPSLNFVKERRMHEYGRLRTNPLPVQISTCEVYATSSLASRNISSLRNSFVLVEY